MWRRAVTDLTELQYKLLDVLEDYGATAPHKAIPPSQIAGLMGLHKGPRRNRGPWSGYQNPAQYIITPLTTLRRRGLVNHSRRQDGLSGTAYYITKEGLATE